MANTISESRVVSTSGHHCIVTPGDNDKWNDHNLIQCYRCCKSYHETCYHLVWQVIFCSGDVDFFDVAGHWTVANPQVEHLLSSVHVACTSRFGLSFWCCWMGDKKLIQKHGDGFHFIIQGLIFWVSIMRSFCLALLISGGEAGKK